MSSADRIRSLSWGDTFFLYLERDGQPLNIASACQFEGKISLQACARFVESKLHLIPRYKQRAVFPPFNVGLPTWERLKTPREPLTSADGCLRLQPRLSPVIRLGAERVFGIGVRGESLEHQAEATDDTEPSLAQVMGVLFNAMFLDNLATGVAHLDRLNELLRDGHIRQTDIEGCERTRPAGNVPDYPFGGFVGACTQPSEGHAVPHSIFRQRAGRDEAACADLMSCLLFTPKYTRELIEIGYNDADRRIDKIEDFLYPSSSANERSADIPRSKPATQPAKRSLREG